MPADRLSPVPVQSANRRGLREGGLWVVVLPVVVACAAALALSTPARSREKSSVDAPGEVFAGETTVVAVEVPVRVVRDGEPVRGLRADDFRVFHDGRRQTVTGFDVVDVGVAAGKGSASGESESPAVPAAARRCFMILFDLAFTEPGFLRKAERAGRDLLAEGLHPSDLVGVSFYSADAGLTTVLQCTPDREQAARVLDGFALLLDGTAPDGAEWRRPEGAGGGETSRRGDPLALSVGDWRATLTDLGRAAGYETSDFAEVLGDLPPISSVGDTYWANIFSHSAQLMEQAYRERRGGHVADLADALEAFGRSTRSLPGSKYLLLFSQGFDAGLVDPSANWATPGNPGVGAGGGAWVLRRLDQAIEALRRSGWVVHALELTGTGAAEGWAQGLLFLADETGGELVENSNRPGKDVQPVIERTGVTYLLTFQTREIPADGAFHPIRVELAEGVERARVRHRAGFYAPAPAGETDAGESRVRAAALILAGEEVGRLDARARATVLGWRAGRAGVSVVMELPDGLTGQEGEVYLYAFDRNGRIGDFLARNVVLEGAGAGGSADPRPIGLKVVGTLELPPGRYDLRVLVREEAASAVGGREALRRIMLDIPEPADGPGVLPPIFVQKPRERWSIASIERTPREGEGPDRVPGHAFTVDGRRIAPSALPVLAPGETARLLLPGFDLAEQGATVATRIVGPDGGTVRQGAIEWLGRAPTPPAGPQILVARLASDGLDPGDYQLEVAVAGRAEASVTAPFRIGSQ